MREDVDGWILVVLIWCKDNLILKQCKIEKQWAKKLILNGDIDFKITIISIKKKLVK